MKNPPWQKDEIMLALDLYLKSYPHIPNKTHYQFIQKILMEITLGIQVE